ncbi:serine hydrolase domain-containing protein [Algoriphagus algorifonticola]|uniref:serine hydrolase domain-containing protein n=1 Tax=Algoriphagus algorifonticola TaxID=2593007 RepID=UPI0011A6014E|nr:serine hydrolase domain-containing protein [Algoriphagus algorifonticola]
MKKSVKRIFQIGMPLLGLASLIFFVPWTILWLWLSPLPETIQDQVDDAITFGLDGIMVYVDQSGKEPIIYSAGYRNRDKKEPFHSQDYFKIASISKLYLAAAVTKLVHQEKLSLDKSLQNYLPELAGKIENSGKISLRMLVQHRSGIPNFSDHPDYPWGNPPPNDEALKFVYNKPSEFTPNEEYRYSNTNYLLIGEIIDQVLGYSHHQFIREELLKPNGLDHTFSLLKEVNPDDVVSGYFVGYEPDIKMNDFTNPGGSMVATIEDVGKFLRLLNDGSLFSAKEMQIYSSLYAYEHTGLLPGYSSIAKFHPNLDTVVIQFVNTSGGDTWTITELIYNRIVKILQNQKD